MYLDEHYFSRIAIQCSKSNFPRDPTPFYYSHHVCTLTSNSRCCSRTRCRWSRLSRPWSALPTGRVHARLFCKGPMSGSTSSGSHLYRQRNSSDKRRRELNYRVLAPRTKTADLTHVSRSGRTSEFSPSSHAHLVRALSFLSRTSLP